MSCAAHAPNLPDSDPPRNVLQNRPIDSPGKRACASQCKFTRKQTRHHYIADWHPMCMCSLWADARNPAMATWAATNGERCILLFPARAKGAAAPRTPTCCPRRGCTPPDARLTRGASGGLGGRWPAPESSRG
eukprot:4876254-Alexandrium_andersonii.AAC.1